MKRRDFIALTGGATAWPLVARAQQPDRTRRIGVLMNLAADDPEAQRRVSAFVQALRELDWTDGRNVQIEYRWGGGDAGTFRKYAAELVALAPDVNLATGTPVMEALQQVTRTVPIVFVKVIDPVGAGFVESLAWPGGNSTGFTLFEYGMSGKWLELLKEIVPGVIRSDARLAMSIAFSGVNGRRICRYKRRRNTNWRSTSKLRKRSASTCRRACSRAPTT